jgi:pimeloyl-ACP methyl ester carboxylesterase
MSHVVVEGRSIAYDHYSGSGEPLVFVHGWCCGRWGFAPQVAHALSRGHEVLTLDLPGHGDSDPLGGPISMGTLADAVRGTMAAVGIDRAVVAGHGDDATRNAVMQAFVEGFFHPVAAQCIKELAVREMTGASLETMLGCWDAMYAMDGPAVLAGVDRPVLHVAATPPLNPVDTFASMLSDCTTGCTVGAGHFTQLEVPEQVNSMIDHFLVALAAR